MCALFSYTLLKNACGFMLSYHNECMYNTVNHCKKYTISNFNVLIVFCDMNLVMIDTAKLQL